MQKLTLAKTFSITRIGVGLYTFYFYFQILSNPSNLFIDQTIDFFKSPLVSWLGPIPNLMPTVAILGLLLGVLLVFGVARRVVSPLLWMTLVLTLGQNVLLHEVHLDYYGWTLLLFTFVPAGEPWSVSPRAKEEWTFPREYYFAVTICFGVSYSISGLAKLLTPEWDSGQMLEAFQRIGFQTAGSLNSRFASASAWCIGLTEFSALPLILFKTTRRWIWLALTVGQLGLALTSSLAQISIFMILFHLLLWDPAWISFERA